MKLDVFTHVFPRRFFDRMLEVAGELGDMGKRVRGLTTLYDLDRRFRVMDEFGDDYRQVLSLASPPIESYASPSQAVELARLANEGMADLVEKHRDRFPAFVAALPMNDVEAALRELERAAGELGARGVQLFTNVRGRPLDGRDLRSGMALIAAGLAADGAVTVEGHFVGRLTGVQFEAAQGSSVLEEKALRAARNRGR